MDHITAYDRVHFNCDGTAVKWEQSFDGETWEPVECDVIPFVLIRQVPLPTHVTVEAWITK